MTYEQELGEKYQAVSKRLGLPHDFYRRTPRQKLPPPADVVEAVNEIIGPKLADLFSDEQEQQQEPSGILRTAAYCP